MINFLFHLDFLDKTFGNKNIASLDYGCGTGEFIAYANKNGYNFKGVDNYYNETTINEYEQSTSKIYIYILIKNNKIPFGDNTFDHICSEQVFEHIEDLDSVLFELNRVLKENGKMLHIFPFVDYIKEGHYGIPFFHRFKSDTTLRRAWTFGMYILGFGFHKKKGKKFSQWYKEASSFIDNHCFYRTKKEIYDASSKYFIIERKEKEKVLFHLQMKKPNILIKALYLIIKLIPEKWISILIQKRGSVVLAMEKKNT
jgi:ubiquinone/menaquinone biosynthesis C-methylase UbiE